KNRSSRRRVPLHRAVVEAGFVTWAASYRDGRLFPGTSSAAGKRYRRWARRLVPDERKVFHSWRHTVITLLREAQVPVDIRSAITGHSDGSVQARYGSQYPLSVLAENVAKIVY